MASADLESLTEITLAKLKTRARLEAMSKRERAKLSRLAGSFSLAVGMKFIL